MLTNHGTISHSLIVGIMTNLTPKYVLHLYFVYFEIHSTRPRRELDHKISIVYTYFEPDKTCI